MKKSLISLTIILVLLAGVGCQSILPGKDSPAKAEAEWPTQAWQVSTPEEQGMDSGLLADMLAEIQARKINMHSLLVIRNGYMVLEAYYPPYTAETRHTIQSITKTVIASLTGIAVEQGLIKGVDEKLVDLFPNRTIQNRDVQKEAITLKHMLSMTSGLDCEDNTAAANGMFATQDWIQYMLDLPVISTPGEKWAYCSGGPHVISALLQETSGMDARTYANQKLFAPLGIAPVEPIDWVADPQGINQGVAGLYLTPREVAKYGYLYLHNGKWDGTQVIPEKWVEDSIGKQAYLGADDFSAGLDRWFGYMWSVFPDQKFYGYLGRSGQELFVYPEENLVVVTTASMPIQTEAELLKMINAYVLPAVKEDKPVKASPEAAARLQGAVAAASGPVHTPAALPQGIAEISGKTYTLDANPLGWTALTFTFTEGAGEAELSMPDTPPVKIGLDGSYRLLEAPGGRANGFLGEWTDSGQLLVRSIILGEFNEKLAQVSFTGNEIKISVTDVNFPGPAVEVVGRIQ